MKLFLKLMILFVTLSSLTSTAFAKTPAAWLKDLGILGRTQTVKATMLYLGSAVSDKKRNMPITITQVNDRTFNVETDAFSSDLTVKSFDENLQYLVLFRANSVMEEENEYFTVKVGHSYGKDVIELNYKSMGYDGYHVRIPQ